MKYYRTWANALHLYISSIQPSPSFPAEAFPILSPNHTAPATQIQGARPLSFPMVLEICTNHLSSGPNDTACS